MPTAPGWPTSGGIFDLPGKQARIDSLETQVMEGGEFVRVLSWYDNEWGFSNRMIDTTVAIGKTL